MDSEIDETYLNFKMTLNQIISVIHVENMTPGRFGLKQELGRIVINLMAIFEHLFIEKCQLRHL